MRPREGLAAGSKGQARRRPRAPQSGSKSLRPGATRKRAAGHQGPGAADRLPCRIAPRPPPAGIGTGSPLTWMQRSPPNDPNEPRTETHRVRPGPPSLSARTAPCLRCPPCGLACPTSPPGVGTPSGVRFQPLPVSLTAATCFWPLSTCSLDTSKAPEPGARPGYTQRTPRPDTGHLCPLSLATLPALGAGGKAGLPVAPDPSPPGAPTKSPFTIAMCSWNPRVP